MRPGPLNNFMFGLAGNHWIGKQITSGNRFRWYSLVMFAPFRSPVYLLPNNGHRRGKLLFHSVLWFAKHFWRAQGGMERLGVFEIWPFRTRFIIVFHMWIPTAVDPSLHTYQSRWVQPGDKGHSRSNTAWANRPGIFEQEWWKPDGNLQNKFGVFAAP